MGKLARTLGAIVLGTGLVFAGCDGPTEPNKSPVANFTANPSSGYAPLTVNFDGSDSYDPDGSITAYRWDFNSDGEIDEQGIQANHIFTDIGNYTTLLEVEDNKGETSSKTLEVVVSDGGPAINISSSSSNEDEQYILNLNEITSPFYSLDNLVISFSSPELDGDQDGSELSLINSTENWNGSTYFDITVIDPDSRTSGKRVDWIINPQSDIEGILVHNLTGDPLVNHQIISGEEIIYTDSEGKFKLQVANGFRTLDCLLDDVYYGRRPQIFADGQDFSIDIYMMKIFMDAVNGMDGLQHMKDTGPFHHQTGELTRWDLPIETYIDNNPVSQAYRDSLLACHFPRA